MGLLQAKTIVYSFPRSGCSYPLETPTYTSCYILILHFLLFSSHNTSMKLIGLHFLKSIFMIIKLLILYWEQLSELEMKKNFHSQVFVWKVARAKIWKANKGRKLDGKILRKRKETVFIQYMRHIMPRFFWCERIPVLRDFHLWTQYPHVRKTLGKCLSYFLTVAEYLHTWTWGGSSWSWGFSAVGFSIMDLKYLEVLSPWIHLHNAVILWIHFFFFRNITILSIIFQRSSFRTVENYTSGQKWSA